MSDSSSAEPSALLWLLACVVGMLAAYVAQGWVRLANRSHRPWLDWRALLPAAAALGTGITSTVLLAMSAAALPFPLGYQALPAAGLWLGAMFGCLPVVTVAASSRRWWVLLFSGLLLAALVAALQFGWIWAAGFRPGVVWRREIVGAAVLFLMVGLPVALWLAHADHGDEGSVRKKLPWQLGGAVLLGLVLVGGQEGLSYASSMLAQNGSVFQHELPGSVLSLLTGVVGPLVLTMMALDLVLRTRDGSRRRRRRSGPDNFEGRKRTKRRHRVRRLD